MMLYIVITNPDSYPGDVTYVHELGNEWDSYGETGKELECHVRRAYKRRQIKHYLVFISDELK